MSVDKLIEKSVKNMGTGMHPVVKETVIELIRRCYAEGIYIFITDGYRSYTEQAAIYGQGRKSYVYNGKDYGQPGKNVVSNAKPGYSNHNFGVAVDFVLTNKEGTAAYWTVDSKWRRAAQIAKSLKMDWGGDWKSFPDYPHLEMTGGLSTSQMRSGKRPNLKLNFTPKTGSAGSVDKVADNTPSERHEEAIAWAKAQGISDGSNPTGEPTREQVIQMLYNLYKFMTPQSQEPSPSFKEALEWAKANGVSDGSKPKDYTTREQTIQMLYKAKGVK